MRMKAVLTLAVTLACVLPASPVAAQEEQPEVFFTAYFECDQTREARADTIVQQVLGPIYDRHVSQGNLSNWGWLSHQVGGKWRRAAWYSAADGDALFAAREQILAEVQREHADAGREFTAICSAHDDYLWRSVASSPTTGAEPGAGDVGISAYYKCYQAKEAHADSLVINNLAPVFNRHVSEDELISWGWNAHMMGGEFRRLWTLRASDRQKLMSSWGAIVADLQSEQPSAMQEFLGVCPSHDDYMWSLVR